MRVNHAAVVLAAVVDFVFAAGWFTLFSKPYLADLRMTQEEIAYHRTHMSPWPYVISFLCFLLTAYILGWLIARMGEHTAARGICLGSAIGLVMAAAIVTEQLFERHALSFIAVAAGFPLLGTTIMGAIIGAWKRKAVTAKAASA